MNKQMSKTLEAVYIYTHTHLLIKPIGFVCYAVKNKINKTIEMVGYKASTKILKK